MDDWKTILTILSFLGGVPTVTLMDHPWLPCRVILGYDMGSVPSINHFLEWWNLWLKRPQEVLKSGVLVCWGINSKSSSIYYDVCNCLISSWSQYRTHTHTQYPNITAKYQVFFIVLFSLLAYTGLIFCEKYVDRGFLWFLHIFFLYHGWFQDSVCIPGLRAGCVAKKLDSPIHLSTCDGSSLLLQQISAVEIRKQGLEDG